MQVKITKKIRSCRICKKTLPKSRYFNHKECMDKKGIIYEDWSEKYAIRL